MKKIIFCLSVFVMGNAFANVLLDQQELENLVKKSVEKNQEIKNSGIAVSIFTKDKILYANGFGFTDNENFQPVTTKTLFGIASTTKAFTSLGVKLLENQGLLKIEDRVKKHLSNFKLSNAYITHNATIEDLLSHRIGLPRHDFLWYATPFKRRELFEKMQYLDFPENAEEKFRKTLQYNNLLYSIAGILIEEKSGMSWEEFTQRRILNPLKMNHTYFGLSHIKDNEEVATPYVKDFKLELRDISNIGPAGSIYSSTEDMTKWIQSFLNHKWKNQDDLLVPKIPLENGPEGTMNYAYALGWMVTDFPENRAKWFFHDGAIDGFSTLVLFSYDLNLGMIVVTNQHRSAVPNAVISDVLVNVIQSRQREKSSSIKIKPLSLNFDQAFAPQKKIKRGQEKLFHHPAYGEIAYGQEDDQEYIRYYNYTWILSDYNEDGFNRVGNNMYINNLRFLIADEFIEVPFEEQVANIKYMKIE